MKCLLTIGSAQAAMTGVVDRRRLTVPLSALAHAVLGAGLVIVPMLASHSLPRVVIGDLTVPVVWPNAGAPVAGGGGGGSTPVVRPLQRRSAVTLPQRVEQSAAEPVMSDVAPTLDEWPEPEGGGLCVGTCTDRGGGVGRGAEPPRLPPVTSTTETVRAGRGGLVQEPRKVAHVEPIYPALARAARVQGRVQMECTLDTNGLVSEISVLAGSPLLTSAAVEAVRQWRYMPTLLNGVPVAVRMSVVVDFRLT